MQYPLMDEATPPGGEGGGGGSGGGENTPPAEQKPAEQKPAEQKPAEQPKTLLDGGDKPNGGEGGGKKPAPGKSGSLLDDDTPPAEQKPGEEGGENAPAPPTEEQIAEFCKGIPALDMGDGVKWDDATLKAIAPSLMEMTGGDAKKAQPIVKAYADHMQKLAKAQAEAADAFNNGLIAECNKRFGADLKKIAGYAKKGGAAIFGDKIWNEMKTIPSFANNPDIMERLAEFGRRISTDGGRVATKDGDPAPGEGDVLHRMYGNVKV